MSPADQGLVLAVRLADDRSRLIVADTRGTEARLPLLQPAEVMGAAARRLDLDGAGLAGLPVPARLDLLRTCRRLLVPGGVLRVNPGGGGDARAAARSLAADAWLCGFEAPAAPAGDGFTLTTPRRRADEPSLVSILVPAYKPDHLDRCLRSALDQTHPHCEIVLCDDSGGGAVEAVVRRMAPDRVRYIRNPVNLGGQANYLQCFAEARGRYVKFLNDDDVLAPGCVAAMAGCLDRNPQVTLVTSYRQLIDEDGRPLPDLAFNRPLAPCDALFEGRHLATLLLTEKVNRIGEPTTAMFRKEDVLANRPHLFSFNGTPARRNGDTFIWAALLSRGDAVYLAEPLSGFRQHQGQVQRDPAFLADARRVWKELADDGRRCGLVHEGFLTGPAPFPCPSGAWPAADYADHRTSPAVTALLAEGNLNAAIMWLRSRLHRRPGHVRLRSDLGGVLWAAGRREAALAETLLALRPDPDPTTLLNLRDMLAVAEPA